MLPLVELDGLDVLPATPEELFLPLPLHHVLPDGNRHAHENSHDHDNDGHAEKDITGRGALSTVALAKADQELPPCP